MSYYTKLFAQIILYSLAKLILVRRLTKKRIRPTGSPHMLVVNHRSAFDPFATVGGLHYRDFFRLAPFSFMTANVFYRKAYLRPLLWLAGCFPAKKGYGDYGIDKAVKDLRSGYSVLIFPEGKRVRKDKPVPARHGVIAIARQVEGIQLLLVHIEWAGSPARPELRYAYRQNGPEVDEPDVIMDEIYSL